MLWSQWYMYLVHCQHSGSAVGHAWNIESRVTITDESCVSYGGGGGGHFVSVLLAQ